MKLPQLYLRELFLLVVIAAMGCGWWVERSRSKLHSDMWREHAAYWEAKAERLLVECIKNDPTIPLEGRRFYDVPPTP